MTFFKVSLVCALMVVALCDGKPQISKTPTKLMEQPHNYENCRDPSQATVLLENKEVHVPGRLFRSVTQEVRFPEIGINDKLLTCVFITDLKNDGSGGYPTVLNGGVGYYTMDVLLTSQSGRGLDFRIQVYAAPPATTTTPAPSALH